MRLWLVGLARIGFDYMKFYIYTSITLDMGYWYANIIMYLSTLKDR